VKKPAPVKKPEPEKKPEPKPVPAQREKGVKGMLHRVRDYRKRRVLRKVVKQKLYGITPLRKAVHGMKKLLKRK
jgi:hypothetical protein